MSRGYTAWEGIMQGQSLTNEGRGNIVVSSRIASLDSILFS
jgi:hypothetical protein